MISAKLYNHKAYSKLCRCINSTIDLRISDKIKIGFIRELRDIIIEELKDE